MGIVGRVGPVRHPVLAHAVGKLNHGAQDPLPLRPGSARCRRSGAGRCRWSGPPGTGGGCSTRFVSRWEGSSRCRWGRGTPSRREAACTARVTACCAGEPDEFEPDGGWAVHYRLAVPADVTAVLAPLGHHRGYEGARRSRTTRSSPMPWSRGCGIRAMAAGVAYDGSARRRTRRYHNQPCNA